MFITELPTDCLLRLQVHLGIFVNVVRLATCCRDLRVLYEPEIEWVKQNYGDTILEICRLPHLPPVFKTDIRCIALFAVRRSGMALKDVSLELRADEGVVLQAVGQNGEALQHAAKVLLSNKEVVLAAVRQNGNALRFAEAFQWDEEVVLAAVRQNGHALQYAHVMLRGNEQVAIAAVAQNGFSLQHALRFLRDSRRVVVVAVKQNAWAIRYASWDMVNDMFVQQEALKDTHNAGIRMYLRQNCHFETAEY